MKFGMKANEFAGLTAVVLSIVALLLALCGNFWCKYAYTPMTISSEGGLVNTTLNIYYGIWNYKSTSTVLYTDGTGLYSYSYSSCRGFSGQYVTPNAKWNTAKAFSIIAVSIGGIAMFASCAAFAKPQLWMIISLALAFTTLFQGLTFLFLSSNACTFTGDQVNNLINHQSIPVMADIGQNCILSSGARLGISATVFWFVSGIAAALAGKKGASEDRDEAVEVKQQDNAIAQPEEAIEEGM